MSTDWSEQILSYHLGLKTNIPLPKGVEWIYPYSEEETVRCMELFYRKYYSDRSERVMLLGINPGRFGAGITGVPFTDPVKLTEDCQIANSFQQRSELSSSFVYQTINELGGPTQFCKYFYIASVCPLGFVKDGKNYNYYDSADLIQSVLPLIIENIRAQIDMGARTDVVFSMGKGTNYKFLLKLNKEHQFFDKVLPLPHPRWVMQYRLKSKDEHIQSYVEALNGAISSQQ